MQTSADVLLISAGLAGLVAAAEATAAGKKVLVLDQEPEQSLGGQAFWSFGGLFLVDSPEQRRLGIRDSFDLAWADWQATAGFDRPTARRPLVKSAAGCGSEVLGFFRWWAGPSGGRWGERARQLGAALPRHVGHRAGGSGALRGASPRSGS